MTVRHRRNNISKKSTILKTETTRERQGTVLTQESKARDLSPTWHHHSKQPYRKCVTRSTHTCLHRTQQRTCHHWELISTTSNHGPQKTIRPKTTNPTSSRHRVTPGGPTQRITIQHRQGHQSSLKNTVEPRVYHTCDGIVRPLPRVPF
jgi:hypothetical protein